MGTSRPRKRNERKGEEPAPDDEGGILSIPGWLPPLLFGVVTLLLFREFAFSDRMLYGGDTLSLGYMAREFYADAVTQSGVFPRWNPLLLGGTPFLESLAGGDSLYPTSVLLFILAPYRALGWKLVIHVFLGGLFMFGWVRSLDRSRAAALLSGLAFAVAPFMVGLAYPGHDGKLFVTALTPLLFWAMETTFRHRGLLPYVGLSLVVALVILTTHFQLAYFLFGSAGLYYLFRVIAVWRRAGPEAGVAGSGSAAGTEPGPEGEAEPRTATGTGGGRRRLAPALARYGLFLAASVVGAAVAGLQLIPAFDYVTEFSRRTATTTRADPAANRAYASSWALHPEEVVSFVVPEFAGNDAQGDMWDTGRYWGRNPFKNNHEYAGWVVLLLAVAGFFGTPRKALRWFLAALGGVALLYALGTHTPVWGLFYELLPGVRLFRAPSMVSFLFGFSAITLMAFGVDRVIGLCRDGEGEGSDGLLRALWILTGAMAVGMVLAASGILFSLWTSTVYSGIDPSRLQALEAQQPMIVRGFFISTVLAAMTAATAWAARKSFLKPLGVVALLAVLVFLDGFRISSSFVQTLDFQRWAAPDPIVEELIRRQGSEPPFRVASLSQSGQDVRPAQFGLELATGHHPNDLARYRELIGMEGSGEPRHILEPNVRRILNVRYLIWPDAARGSLGQGPEPVARTQLRGRPYESLYPLDGLPRARLVAEARTVADDEAVAVIRSETFDPEVEAVLASEPGMELGGGVPDGDVTWEERGLNRQRLRVTTDRNALLVLADNWFPAWKATVDGEDAPVLRAYHTLRAVPVPAGEHTVELRYESAVLRSSLGVSVGALLFLLAVGALSFFRRRGGRAETPG